MHVYAMHTSIILCDAYIYVPQSLTMMHVCMMHISMILDLDPETCVYVACMVRVCMMCVCMMQMFLDLHIYFMHVCMMHIHMFLDHYAYVLDALVYDAYICDP